MSRKGLGFGVKGDSVAGYARRKADPVRPKKEHRGGCLFLRGREKGSLPLLPKKGDVSVMYLMREKRERHSTNDQVKHQPQAIIGVVVFGSWINALKKEKREPLQWSFGGNEIKTTPMLEGRFLKMSKSS